MHVVELNPDPYNAVGAASVASIKSDDVVCGARGDGRTMRSVSTACGMEKICSGSVK